MALTRPAAKGDLRSARQREIDEKQNRLDREADDEHVVAAIGIRAATIENARSASKKDKWSRLASWRAAEKTPNAWNRKSLDAEPKSAVLQLAAGANGSGLRKRCAGRPLLFVGASEA